MSPLNSLVNYMIFLGVGLQGILAAPTETADLSVDNADSVVKGDEMRVDKREASTCTSTANKYPGNQWYVLMNDMMCACNAGSARPLIRPDYHYTRGIGYHKVHTQALDWNQARKMCLKEGAHLSILNSITEATVSNNRGGILSVVDKSSYDRLRLTDPRPAESVDSIERVDASAATRVMAYLSLDVAWNSGSVFDIIMDMYKKAGTMNGAVYQDQILLGMHDMFKEGEFTTVLDYQLESSGYTVWAVGQPDNGGGRGQNCGSMYRDGTFDDVECDLALGFVCEIAEIRLF